MNAVRVSFCLFVAVGLCHCQRFDPGDVRAGTSTDEAAAVNPQLTANAPPKPHLACPSPTLAQCRSPLWRWTRCGKLEMARARLDPESPCNLLLGEAAQALSAYLPTREVVAPSVVSATGVVSAATRRDGNDCLADVGHTCVRYQPYSNNGHFARGFGSTSYGLAAKGTSFLPLDNHSEEAARYRMMNAIRDAVYAGNGNAVASCGEYVYEKYFDYSTFEEVSARYGNTARSFVDTAYAASDLRSSIGTRWIAGMPLAGRDDTPFTDGIAFPTNQKKNVFFETPVVTDETTGGLGVQLEVEMPCFSRDAVSIGGVYLNDETLTALIQQDPRHDESFAWHRDMNQAMLDAEILDEELYNLDALKREFRVLLERRARITRAFVDMLEAAVSAVDQTREVNLNPLDDVVDPVTLLGYLAAMDAAGVDVLSAGGQRPATTAFAAFPPMDFSGLEPVPEPELQASLQGIADGICAATDPNDQPTTAARFMAAFALVDQAIEDALTEARDRGCLDVDDPFSPCDWSPELFAARAVGLFAEEREHDFETCMDYTANDFNKLNGKQFVVNGDVICAARDFRESPAAVEDYIVCVDEWREATIAEIESTQGSILDPATGKLRVGKTGADVFELGNDMLGATLDYEGGWSVTGFEGAQDVGALSISLDGHASASAYIFGGSALLADAGVKVNTEQIDVDLTVLNEDVYLSPPEQEFEQGVMHALEDTRGFSTVFIQSSVVVPVLGIPVTVRGGISGEAGLNYGVSALTQSQPVDRQLVTLVEPYMGAKAFVSASIDAAIVEVGVKGSVTVVRLGMPIAAGVHIHLPAGMQDMQLVVDSQGDFTIDMLSGRVAVFGEIDTWVWSESVEIPLFSWGGFKDETNLYRMAYSVPIEPLFWLAHQDPY